MCLEENRCEQVLDHLNSLRSSIHFTMEMESGNFLSFVDAILTRRSNGSMDVGVYRKPSHTDHYLNYSSHHPVHVKREVASGLVHRARTIAQGPNVSEEESHVCEALRANGYPGHLIASSMKLRKKKDFKEDPKHTTSTCFEPE